MGRDPATTPQGHERPTVIALRALGLGDLLECVPVLRALADSFPDHDRLLAAPGTLAPVAALVGEGWSVVDTSPLAPLGPALQQADIAVNLQGKGPQSHRLLLAARPARLIAYSHPKVPVSWKGPAWDPDEGEVARWCRLLEESGIPVDPSRADLRRPDQVLAEGAVGATLVHPGAGSAARRWPANRWAAVARAEVESGRPVVVTGGVDEIGLAQSVAEGAGLSSHAVLAGRTDLGELAALVAAAGRVLSGDTGVARLAVALGTPSVTLYGPRPPEEGGLPLDRRRHRTLWAGRRGDAEAERTDPGLLEIEIEQVTAVLALLPEAHEIAPAERADDLPGERAQV